MGTFSGALAVVKVGGKIVGRMTNIQVSEDIATETVRELGNMFPVEIVATGYSGSFTCDFFEADFRGTGIDDGNINKFTTTDQEFGDTLSLVEYGIDVDIFQKTSSNIDPLTANVTTEDTPYMQIRGAKPTSNNWNIMSGRVSTRNQSFLFIKPLIRNQS